MDSISILLTCIRNAQKSLIEQIFVSYSRIRLNILNILLKKKYIKRYVLITFNKIGVIKICLLYYNNNPIIKVIKRISKPSRRIYIKYSNLFIFSKGLNLVILSTSKGIISHKEAIRKQVGGELICYII